MNKKDICKMCIEEAYDNSLKLNLKQDGFKNYLKHIDSLTEWENPILSFQKKNIANKKLDMTIFKFFPMKVFNKDSSTFYENDKALLSFIDKNINKTCPYCKYNLEHVLLNDP